MKYSTTVIGAAALCISEVAAFPAAVFDLSAKASQDLETRKSLERRFDNFYATRAQPTFNASAQYVSNQGAHAFVAPDLNTEARGPCPGLNAMANHNYLPHNGVANIQQFIDSTYEGMQDKSLSIFFVNSF